ncbi:MAG: sporulation initiation inhibitor Soj [Candidatus Roseilinea sp.]|nr:MAG: sporulation initiation inhibitor Soj [Candidatus Roseilinea sp.]
MTRIYAIANQKGGVGKTTTAVNLSAYLALAGRRILLVDMDPQCNAGSSLGLDKHKVAASSYEVLLGNVTPAKATLKNARLNLSVIPASPALAAAEIELVGELAREYRLRQALAAEASKYDYVLIDCPPSLGLLTVNALTAADGVLIPVQCEYLALEGLSQLTRTVQLVRQRLNPQLEIRGLIMTMYDARTALSQQVVAEVEKFFAGKVFRARIPRNVRLSEAPSHGQPIITYAPSSPGGQAYKGLAEELMAQDEAATANVPTTNAADAPAPDGAAALQTADTP